MGLDMFLEVEKIVLRDTKEYANIATIAAFRSLASDTPQFATVSVVAAYWRKANAIHGWFVREVQGGQDMGQRSHVDASQLIDLLALTKLSISLYNSGDKEKLLELLPPVEGFFFGSTEMDELYLTDLQNTESMLTRITTAPGFDECQYYYRASW